MNNREKKLPRLPTCLPRLSPEKKKEMMERATRTAGKVSRGEAVNGT